MIDFEKKYAPKTLDDVVFHDDQTRDTIFAYARGETARDLFLYGPVGTGKTTIAKLVPVAMVPDLQKPDLRLLNASDDRSLTSLRDKAKEFLKMSGFNSAGMRFVILDEVDGLDKKAADALRGMIDSKPNGSLYLLTTNYQHEVPEAIRSRCTCVRIDRTPAERWLPRARWIMEQEGCPRSDEKLLPVIEAAQGDNRRVLQNLQKVVMKASATVAPGDGKVAGKIVPMSPPPQNQ